MDANTLFVEKRTRRDKRRGMKKILPALFITLCFWGFTLLHINRPATYNFDEFHYVPAAKAFLATREMRNTEHPPLGKTLIAQGISLFGDKPFGWRVMSSLFGALTLLGLYFWALHLFKSTRNALFVALVSAFNQLLYVQSRIAMLDTFMACFLVWASFCFSYWWDNRNKNWVLFLSALLFGWAIATKWFAIIPMGVTGLLMLYLFFKEKKIKLTTIIFFSLLVIASYSSSFLPFDFTLAHLLEWQKIMWDRQHMALSTHAYSSPWWSWPFELRPIWYFYESIKETDSFRGIFFLGNPLIFLGGVIAAFICAWQALIKKSQTARQVLLCYLVCLLSWPIIPRKLTFFYYYYPASLMLGLLLAQVLNRKPRLRLIFLVCSAGFFIYFLPILDASLEPLKFFRQWVWFERWI